MSPFAEGGSFCFPVGFQSVPIDWIDAIRAGERIRLSLARANTTRRTFRRSEEHTSELQSLMRISYAVFCLKKKNKLQTIKRTTHRDTNTAKARQTNKHEYKM